MADAKRFQWTPLLIFTLGFLALLVIGWIVMLLRSSHNTGVGASSVARAPRSLNHNTAQHRVDPAYAKILAQQEAAQAAAADKNGSTYVPPPRVMTGHNDGLLSILSPNAPLLHSPQTTDTSATSSSNSANSGQLVMGNSQNDPNLQSSGANTGSYQARKEKLDKIALVALIKRLHKIPALTTVIATPKSQSTGSLTTRSSSSGRRSSFGKGSSGAPALPANLVTVLRPGAMLYAENDLALNSDSPGPVEATILAGPLTGARALGAMSKTGNYLTLQFTSVTTKAGATYAIHGYGVNPKIPATSVRTAVDKHILSRWGGLLAASFLQGYGQAITQSGSSISSSYGSTVATMPMLTPQQELLVAAGTVGQQLASVMQANFNRPNTVTFNPGVPLAILIIKG